MIETLASVRFGYVAGGDCEVGWALRFIDQAGAHTDSVFGGTFKDDEGGLQIKHDRAGLLSMANGGPDTNTSHFRYVRCCALYGCQLLGTAWVVEATSERST